MNEAVLDQTYIEEHPNRSSTHCRNKDETNMETESKQKHNKANDRHSTDSPSLIALAPSVDDQTGRQPAE